METPEFKVTLLTDEEFQRRLSEFEDRYGMTSQEFLPRYNRGELGDDFDFIDWAGLLRLQWKAADKARRRPA